MVSVGRRASLWWGLVHVLKDAFEISYAPEKTLLTHPYKLKVLVLLCVRNGVGMVIPTHTHAPVLRSLLRWCQTQHALLFTEVMELLLL